MHCPMTVMMARLIACPGMTATASRLFASAFAVICVVPNSAIRKDSNGSFVLVVTVKSSPLGNRYTATRVDVEVIASDDTSSAVTGALNQNDYVITTSSKPITSGDMVRLPDNL